MSRRAPVAKLWLVAAALTLLCALPGVASADSNLVVNGRFQQPAIGAGNWGNVGRSIPGWQETTGCGIELWANGFIIPSPFQAQVLELNSNCPSRIAQTITTTPGQQYTVTYYFGARPGTGTAENVIEAAWNGTAESQETTAGTTLQQYSFTVTGTGSDVLSLRSATYNTGVGTLLSLVSVTPADQGPQIEYSPADVSGTVGQQLTTTGKFVNPSGGALTMSASVGSVSPQSDGSFTWTHTPTSAITAAPVTVTATDGDGRSATATFTMTATPAPTVSVTGCITRNANGSLASYEAQISNLAAQPVYVFTEGSAGVNTTLSDMYRYGAGPVNGTTTIAVSYPAKLVPASATSVYVKVRPYPNYNSGVLAQTTVPLCNADTTPPVETAAVTGTTGALGWYTSDVSISWLVTDPQSPVTSTSGCTSQVVSADTAGTSFTCAATSAGGTSSSSVSVKRDATPPTLSLPTAPVVVEATGSSGAEASWDATASDATSGLGGVLCSQPPGSTFVLGDTPVTCEATDAAGNHTRGTFTVRVVDTTAPMFVAPQDLTKEAVGPDGAEVSFDAPVTDDVVDGAGMASCSPESGSTFALGTTQVTCSATDAAGNTRSKSFAVKVEDTTAPAVEVDDQTVEAAGPDGTDVDLGASATDLVDGQVDTHCEPGSGSAFALGSTEVTCSATDAHGNEARSSATIKVVDTTAPAFDAPGDITAEATDAAGAKVSYTSPNTADAVGGAGVAACAPASDSTFALGTTQVTCSATDAAGNGASKSFEVRVRDTTAPKLTLPADIATSATSAHGAEASFATTAADTVDGALPVSCTRESGTQFAPGVTTVDCTATDKAGNAATGSFKVSVTFAWGDGFVEPIKNNALTGNINRTIPLKFSLIGASAGITVAKAYVLLGLHGNTLAQVAVETVSGGSFYYNLSTKGLTPGVYTVRVDLGDGVKRDATLTLS